MEEVKIVNIDASFGSIFNFVVKFLLAFWLVNGLIFVSVVAAFIALGGNLPF